LKQEINSIDEQHCSQKIQNPVKEKCKFFHDAGRSSGNAGKMHQYAAKMLFRSGGKLCGSLPEYPYPQDRTGTFFCTL